LEAKLSRWQPGGRRLARTRPICVPRFSPVASLALMIPTVQRVPERRAAARTERRSAGEVSYLK